jgi:hypothetical protein
MSTSGPSTASRVELTRVVPWPPVEHDASVTRAAARAASPAAGALDGDGADDPTDTTDINATVVVTPTTLAIAAAVAVLMHQRYAAHVREVPARWEAGGAEEPERGTLGACRPAGCWLLCSGLPRQPRSSLC